MDTSDDDQGKALQQFLAQHVRPYDAATDEYERPPFAADIKEGKNDPIYSAHSYHTKVPPRSIIPYILHYTQPGDLVLDLFCGSGMTGVAAQMCARPPADILDSFPEFKGRVGSRACILNDLSPAACHIAYNYNTPVDVDALKQEFERIKSVVKKEFDWLYGTEHYEPAAGVYDTSKPEVANRLKNPPGGKSKHNLLEEDERTWELITKPEVEARLGYPVTELPHDEKWENLDVVKVKQWICIPATIQYTVWSDIYRCEGFVTIEEPTGKVRTRGKNAGKPIVQTKRVHRGCGKEFILWETAVDKTTGDVAESFACPYCGQVWGKKQLTLMKPIPVVTDYEFLGLRTRSSAPMEAIIRTSRRFTQKEAKFISELNKTPIPYWHPQDEVDTGREMLRHGLLKRGIQRISDFYTRRNLWAMARLWKEIESQSHQRIRKFLRFAFTSIIPYVSLKQSYGGGGGGLSSTLYIASLTSEKNVAEVFDRKAVSLIRSLPNFNALAQTTDVKVLLGSAVNVSLPNESVDYIFADPPFGSNIYYADCSLLWETWLGQLTDEAKEMVVSERRVNGPFKTLDDYARMMAKTFEEMFRVLKPGRWATIEFNNSDGRVFDAIKKGVADAGFQIANMLLLDKTQKSFKQVKGATGAEDVVDKDVLFNLHKPAVLRAEVRTENHDLEQQVADTVRHHLQSLPERIKADPAKYNDEHRTTATINSMLMNALIPRGVSVDRLNLPFIERVCARFFRKIGQRWYLKGEAVGGNGGDELVTEEVTIKDEVSAIDWLRQKLQVHPMLVGELKPYWQKATGLLPAAISQSLILEDLLSENFWRDSDSNRWREPTDEERERMNDDRSFRVLHKSERFLSGNLSLKTTDQERCEWVEVLFQACRDIEEKQEEALPALRGFDVDKAYHVITQLFQSVLKEHVPPEAFRRAEKQYRAAASRLASQVEKETQAAKPKSKDDKQTTLGLKM
jgi:16S rRNA G966 N2-methylase RsmD